jgi:hypothetical protein
MDVRKPRGIRPPALSFTTIASMLAPTGGDIPRCRLGSKHCLIILVTSCQFFARGGGCCILFLSLVDYSNRTLEPDH